MKSAFLSVGVISALLVASAQNADSGARNAVSTPRPTLNIITTNNKVTDSGSRMAVVGNTNTAAPFHGTVDTVGAAPSARQPK